jgi:hypothetical protein
MIGWGHWIGTTILMRPEVSFMRAYDRPAFDTGTALSAAGTLVGTAIAGQKEKSVLAGQADVKRLILLMDADMNGKISKPEFMKFMEAEFDSLDVNKDGELDVKELEKTRLRVAPAHNR